MPKYALYDGDKFMGNVTRHWDGYRLWARYMGCGVYLYSNATQLSEDSKTKADKGFELLSQGAAVLRS